MGSSRIGVLENRASKVDVELKVLPEMVSCAASGEVYHAKDDECVTPISSHCFRIGADEKRAMSKLVKGGVLDDQNLCSFNRHYGGEKCLAKCVPGYMPYRIDAAGKKNPKPFS